MIARLARRPLLYGLLACLAAPAAAYAEPSPTARAYLQDAIGILKQHHLNTTKLDWAAAEAEAWRLADRAEHQEQTYPAIRYLIGKLGDPHSGLITREAYDRMQAGQNPLTGLQKATETPSGVRLSNGAAFVSVPGFAGGGPRGEAYAAAGQRLLTSLDKTDPCGWVVDLRFNAGGNMTPMIQALNGLLGRAPYGRWVSASGDSRPWPTFGQPPVLHAAGRPIAVLSGPSTSSAGEFSLIAFLGLPNVRVFGLPTNGFVSSNRTFPLTDGAQLVVSAAWAEDRSGKRHTTRIEPDEPAADSQAALDAALTWLNTKGCRAP